MKSVRTEGTHPELTVRKLVSRLGGRYRTNVRTLPGKPDLANKKRRWAIFVHGCFWHGHECRSGLAAQTNVEFWNGKIAGNRARDAVATSALRDMGFSVLAVWQCELRAGSSVQAKLAQFLDVNELGTDCGISRRREE